MRHIICISIQNCEGESGRILETLGDIKIPEQNIRYSASRDARSFLGRAVRRLGGGVLSLFDRFTVSPQKNYMKSSQKRKSGGKHKVAQHAITDQNSRING